jgi:hypothetical protein
MKMPDVRRKTKELRLKTQRLQKPDVIRVIQTAEGDVPYFATGRENRDPTGCCWREDCLPKREG